MKILLCIAALSCVFVTVKGHGYLLKPPARGTAWRAGFKTPRDYTDNEMFCGGRGVQHSATNRGQCAVCGEEYSKSQKRMEPGPANKYATGTIVAHYQQGQAIDATIMTTTYHKGYYEFRLCENNVPQKGNDRSIAVTNNCLNRNLLKNARTGGTTFRASPGRSTHQVKLPSHVSCQACVFQWRYRAGNNWGCEGGKCALGLGNQEEFYGCADIAIQSSNGRPMPKQPVISPAANQEKIKEPVSVNKLPARVDKLAEKVLPPVRPSGKKICRGTAAYASKYDAYCNLNCNHDPPFCPQQFCTCQ